MADGPHAHTIAGTFWSHSRELIRSRQSVHIIAGAFRRSVECNSSKLVADTTTRAITVQTPHLFIDLRIASDRPAALRARALDDLSNDELAALLTSTHCFGGITEREPQQPTPWASSSSSAFDDVPIGHSCVCTRWHLIDWQPMPRLSPNRWSVEERWEHGGWAEWSVRRDAAGQAAYVEHWRTLRGSREGPFVALRRLAGSPASSKPAPEAVLLVAGDTFALIAGRSAEDALAMVRPGEGGHPSDRGRVEPLAAAALAAGDRAALLALASLECHFGSVSGSAAAAACPEGHFLRDGAPAAELRWRIDLSAWPWREGTSLAEWIGGFGWRAGALEHAPSGESWEVVHCEGELTSVGDLLSLSGHSRL